MPSPYRADQVGSLLRPHELLEARTAQRPLTELQAIEDRQIIRVLERQKEIGFDVFTDGELRRTNFMSDFTDAVEGFDFGDAVSRNWTDAARKPSQPQPAVSSINGIVTSPFVNASRSPAANFRSCGSTLLARLRSPCPARLSSPPSLLNTALRIVSIMIPTPCSQLSPKSCPQISANWPRAASLISRSMRRATVITSIRSGHPGWKRTSCRSCANAHSLT